MNVIIVTFCFGLFAFGLQLNEHKSSKNIIFETYRHEASDTGKSRDQSLIGESSFSTALITTKLV